MKGKRGEPHKEGAERTFQAKGTKHVEALSYKDFGMERNQKSAWLNRGGVGGASEGLQALFQSGSFIPSVMVSREL